MIKRVLATTATLAMVLLTGCGAPQSLASGPSSLTMPHQDHGLGAYLDPLSTLHIAPPSRNIQASLPRTVDLRRQMPPIYNQGPFQTCTGFAIAKGLAEYFLLQTHRHTELSALYFYQRAKVEQFNTGGIPGIPQEWQVTSAQTLDIGASIKIGMQLLKQVGAAVEAVHPYPSERLWPSYPYAYINPFFDDRLLSDPRFVNSPEREAGLGLSDQFNGPYRSVFRGDDQSERIYLPTQYDKQATFRVREVEAIHTLQRLREVLAEKRPVVCGISMYESFFSAATARTGRVAIPNQQQERFLGGHAVVCVGYDESEKVLIMRNSWGSDWGDGGYFYLPYAYITNDLVTDAWTASL